MRFPTRKRRQPPAIIIISLIDILIVILIFLMVTTTFKQYPALRLALPESKHGQQQGATENSVIVTIDKQEPYLYLEKLPVTEQQLQAALLDRAERNPHLSLSIRADRLAPFEQVIKVMDIAKATHMKSVFAFIKSAGQP